MSVKNIEIIGAKIHNLNNISLNIPKNNLVVISGVSFLENHLLFDTLYRRTKKIYRKFILYARQFLGKLQKPDVESINVSPNVIEQKVISKIQDQQERSPKYMIT